MERNVIGTTKPTRNTPATGNKTSEPNTSWIIERAAAEQAVSEEKTQEIHDHIKALREEIQNTKAEIAARKARLQNRHSEFASAKQELSKGQTGAVENVEKERCALNTDGTPYITRLQSLVSSSAERPRFFTVYSNGSARKVDWAEMSILSEEYQLLTSEISTVWAPTHIARMKLTLMQTLLHHMSPLRTPI